MASSNPYHNEAVPLHKRIAAGENLDGTSLQAKGGQKPAQSKPQGGLSQAKKK